MKPTTSVNYHALIEQTRQEELSDEHQIHTPELVPVYTDDRVDYSAIVKTWNNQQQPGKYEIHANNERKNASHDPERS